MDNKYINKLKKEYRPFIKEFYRDSDGWWIQLDSKGPYILDGYYSQFVIHEDTLKEALEQFRECIAEKQSWKFYLAYGSNLHLQQMSRRCPDAQLVGYTMLPKTRLIFRGSKSGSYLSIEPDAAHEVPCGVFRISDRDERSLDMYEGYPRFYTKVIYTDLPLYNMEGQKIGNKLKAMAYRLPSTSPAGMPTAYYMDVCMTGYDNFGFDHKYLHEAVKITRGAMLNECK